VPILAWQFFFIPFINKSNELFLAWDIFSLFQIPLRCIQERNFLTWRWERIQNIKAGVCQQADTSDADLLWVCSCQRKANIDMHTLKTRRRRLRCRRGHCIICGIRANNQISPAPMFCNFEVPPMNGMLYHCSLLVVAKVRVEQRAAGRSEGVVGGWVHAAGALCLSHSLACIHTRVGSWVHYRSGRSCPVIAPRQSQTQPAVRGVR